MHLSKGWPVPINIDDTVGCNLAMIKADYGLFIMNCLKNVHNVPPASPTHCYMAKCSLAIIFIYVWRNCNMHDCSVMSLNWDIVGKLGL